MSLITDFEQYCGESAECQALMRQLEAKIKAAKDAKIKAAREQEKSEKIKQQAQLAAQQQAQQLSALKKELAQLRGQLAAESDNQLTLRSNMELMQDFKQIFGKQLSAPVKQEIATIEENLRKNGAASADKIESYKHKITDISTQIAKLGTKRVEKTIEGPDYIIHYLAELFDF